MNDAGPARPARPDDDLDVEVRLLLEAIFHKYSYDFRDYALASIKRRLEHALPTLGCGTVSGLQERVFHDPQAFQRLLQYLTIPTTEMFRDPGYYLALRRQVVPVLRTYPSLKVWIAGCSTGEELYSIAILLREEGLLDRTIIYATDINAASLKKAEEGIFPLSAMRKYTSNYQKAGGTGEFADYYTAAYDSAAFDRSLVRSVVFADHSLATDSEFAETQLVSCRNVLIYFNRTLQDRALGLFHGSLCHGGFMGLGSRESIQFSGLAGSFEAVNAPERIFRKR